MRWPKWWSQREISGGAVNALSLSFLLLPGSRPYCLSSQIATVDLSFPLCPSPSSATEVLRLITSLPYFKTLGVLRMKHKLCRETLPQAYGPPS